MDIHDLEKTALEIRKIVIKSIGDLGIGHLGGSMSVVEVLTALYFELMNVEPENPGKEDRDRLVLSKGRCSGPKRFFST